MLLQRLGKFGEGLMWAVWRLGLFAWRRASGVARACLFFLAHVLLFGVFGTGGKDTGIPCPVGGGRRHGSRRRHAPDNRAASLARAGRYPAGEAGPIPRLCRQVFVCAMARL